MFSIPGNGAVRPVTTVPKNTSRESVYLAIRIAHAARTMVGRIKATLVR
jgi:hypothetical protein